MRDRQRTVFIVDPMMINQVGHHYQMMIEIQSVLAQRGAQMRLFVPRSADDVSVVRRFGATPCIDHLPKTSVFPVPEVDIGAVNYRFFIDLTAAAGPAGPNDTVFFPIANHRNLFGIVRWLEERPAEQRPLVAMLLSAYECFDGFNGTVHQRNTRFYTTLLSRLMALKGNRPLLMAYSQGYADHINRLAGPDAQCIKFPFSYLKPIAPQSPELPPTIGLFGNTSWEQKGLDHFLDAAHLLLNAEKTVRFLIQLDDSFALHCRQPQTADNRLKHPAIETIHGGLSPEVYDAQLHRCALIALPYGPAYKLQPSGLLFEALVRGRPVLVPKDSQAMRDAETLHFTPISFASWTAEAIADALANGLDRLAQLTAEAEQVAVKLQSLPSSTKQLVDMFLPALDPNSWR